MNAYMNEVSLVGVRTKLFLSVSLFENLYFCNDQLLRLSPVSGVLLPLSGIGASVL